MTGHNTTRLDTTQRDTTWHNTTQRDTTKHDTTLHLTNLGKDLYRISPYNSVERVTNSVQIGAVKAELPLGREWLSVCNFYTFFTEVVKIG